MNQFNVIHQNRCLFVVVALLAVLGLTATAYWPGLTGGFIFDDFPNLVRSPTLPLTSLTPQAIAETVFSNSSGPTGRPLSMLTFALESYFFGMNPGVMKLTNLGIHLANGVLVFLLLRRVFGLGIAAERSQPLLGGADIVALVTTTAWLLAPINLTGVLFVVQRMESLATLFILAGLLVFVHGRQRLAAGERSALRWLWGGIAGGLALGVTAKESGVMLPVYALVIEWLFFGFGPRDSAERRAVLRLFAVLLLLPAVLGLLWLAPGILANTDLPNRPFTLLERLWTEPRVIWSYVQWMFVPAPASLSLYHDDYLISRGMLTPWTTLPAILALIAAVAAAVCARRRLVWVALGILWFLVMHLLTATFLNLELVYEHRNYLGSLGLFVAVFGLLLDARLREARSVRVFAALALVAMFAFLTTLRAQQWGDPLRLAVIEAQQQPTSPRAQYAAGQLLVESSNGPGSQYFAQGMKQLRHAAALPNGNILPWQALILTSARHGLPINPDWWRGIRKYVTNHPLSSQDTNALYSLIHQASSPEVALDTERLRSVIDAAVVSNPADAKLVTLNANFLLNVTGEFVAARSLLQQAVTLAPRDPAMWRNLIDYQLATGALEQAGASIERLAEVQHFGQRAAAIADFRKRLAARREATAAESSQ